MRHPPLPAPTRRTLQAGGALATGLMLAPRIAAAQAAVNLERVDALIARMTIEEKAGQLNLQNDPFRWRPEGVNPGDTLDTNQEQTAADIRAGRIGALFNGVGAKTTRFVQELAVKESRLGIPLLFAADVVHGLRTTFPVPLGEAANSSGMPSRLSLTASSCTKRVVLAPTPLNRAPMRPARMSAAVCSWLVSSVSPGFTPSGRQRNGSFCRFSCPAFSSMVMRAIRASTRSRFTAAWAAAMRGASISPAVSAPPARSARRVGAGRGR